MCTYMFEKDLLKFFFLFEVTKLIKRCSINLKYSTPYVEEDLLLVASDK